MRCSHRTPSLRTLALWSSFTLLLGCDEALDVQAPRSLGEYQNHQVPHYPGGFPGAWAAEFHLTMANAPLVQIGDPNATELVRDLMLQMAWVDPESVRVLPALPQGLRLAYRPHLPSLAVAHGDKPFAMLSAKGGVVLPDGIAEDVMRQYIRVTIDPGVELPPPGRVPSDPLLQEAFRLWPEVDSIDQNTELFVVSIQRKSTYPKDADGIAPVMSFLLDSGVEISWGRATKTTDPFAINSRGGKLTLEQKVVRLKAVLKQYPDLVGVGRVVLDEPEAKVFSPHGERLPLVGDLR